MKPIKMYDIAFVGLKLGNHQFDYEIDKEFFESFKYEDFNSINANVSVNLIKKNTLLELDFKLQGIVNLNCDVSNLPFDLSIDGSFPLIVKFGEEYNDENEEILIIPHGEYKINVAQYIFELIVLSIPLKRVHPKVESGEIESEILDKLEELRPKERQKKEDEIDPRWNILKKLKTDK